DADGDGVLDLVVANRGGDVSVLRGNGDGTFAAARSLPTGFGTRAVAVADLDGDGRADLAAANRDGDDLSVFFGSPGGFGPERRSATGGFPGEIEATDLNGDGLLDLVVANADDSDVSVLLGERDARGFTCGPQRRFATGTFPAGRTGAF